jgi:predicted DNA-binding antitoxin AbrB/MazE fold protein
METVTAIYEDGVFRPLEPVDLPEHTEVKLQVIEPPKRLRKLSFIGLFDSGQPNLAERVEEIMEQMELDPIEGWKLPDDDSDPIQRDGFPLSSCTGRRRT